MVTIPLTYEELLAHKAAGHIATNNVFYTMPNPGKSDFNVFAAFAPDSSRVFRTWAPTAPESFPTDFPDAILVESFELG